MNAQITYPNYFSNHWGAIIMGAIIDGNVFSYSACDFITLPTHYDLWKDQPEICWRWTHDSCINMSIRNKTRCTPEQYALIREHLTEYYGFQWQENGHFDNQHFGEMMDAEGDIDTVW